jgi:hypothetical protein
VSKLSEDFNIGILGVAAGLFSSSVILLIARIDAYYGWIRGTSNAYERVADLWWVPASVWHIVLSIVAALLIHRYLKDHIRSPFLLWQVVGITSLFGWALTAFVVVSLNCVMHGDLRAVRSLDRFLISDEALLVAKYVATVFACNVLYGSVISASSRQYVEQFDSEVTG